MTEQYLTFEQLPNAVILLTKEINDLKNLLIQKQENSTPKLPENPIHIQEAAQFLGLSVATMYSKVSKGELPVTKRGKRLYFFRSELLSYLKEGSKKSNAEIEAEADAYLSNKKNGLK
ncbi:helix-turn-helix domain-containing protein [Cellulophaga sp. E16_2]|uniref:helix-turn-helix domain-containing protein n=1 Tax=Cellulophaga sp. E16_2 TaxID=2789297 RepID=UPI001A939F3E|nr:helix-turn-helix domain-containing protein [Cellulophaga sp. E16_2]MBO0592931.1 helix-turn-helix domain-containing protein [Cellulophaga sp. E16_2]